MWRAVVFDVGGVLAHQDVAAADEMLRQISPTLTVEAISAALVQPATYPIWEEYSCGNVEGNRYWSAVLRDMGLEGSAQQVSAVREVQAATWWSVLDRQVMSLVSTLSASDGVLLGVLSNSSEEHESFISSFEEHFDVLRFSHRTGLRKPWPEAYTAIAEALAVAPSEIVFIDDRARNIEPARALGMMAVRFTGAGQLAQQLAELGLMDAPGSPA